MIYERSAHTYKRWDTEPYRWPIYKAPTIVIYVSRVINISNLLDITSLESEFTLIGRGSIRLAIVDDLMIANYDF